MAEQASLIQCEVDLDAPGKQTGFLRLPHSVHRSAYGWIPIPIVTVAKDDGPTVLLIAGNHGDEYEGQIALMDLARSVAPDDIAGRLIILPAINFPAVMAGARVSPIDGGNLNREFPGNALGTPTQMIAHFVSSVLAPKVDHCLDIHSGGTSLAYDAVLLSGPPPADPEARNRQRKYIEAIGLPYTLVFRGGGVTGGRNLGTVIRGNGGTAFAAEIGGGAHVSPGSVAKTRAMLWRYLAMTGIWRGEAPSEPPAATRFLANGPDDYLYAMDAGLFEPLASIGDAVEAGQPAALIHFPDTPWRAPVELAFPRAGIVVCARPLAACARGDSLFQTGEPWPDAFD